MDQKLLSYYDKLDIVEEGNSESEENSKHTESVVMNSLSPLGKISSGVQHIDRDNMLEPIAPLNIRMKSNDISSYKRRAISDHLIDIPDFERPRFHDDNFEPTTNQVKLKSIKEKELDYLDNGKDDGQVSLALSGDSNVPQPSSSSTVTH